MFNNIILRQVAVATIVLFPVTGFASGFRIPESSIAGMSLSNAAVANTDIKGAMIYNPAIMSIQEDRRSVTFGLMNIMLDLHVDPENGTATDSQGDDSIPVPAFYYMSKVSPKWAWGLGLYAPFGLETKWPAGTFGLFGASPPLPATVAGLEPETSKIEVANLTPNVSYRLNQNNSVSIGVNYYDVRKLIFNTQAIEINGSGEDFGYTLAYVYKRDAWSFGASYRNEVKVKADGSITAGGITADASAEIEFPGMLQIGVRNQVNQKLAIEFDIERTYWSSFDVVEIHHQHPAQFAPPPNTIPSPITNTNNWTDVNAYRLAATYQLTNAWQLRFGFTLDETPQPDDYFSARIPDADRQLYSFGVSYKPDSWEFEAGIMYVKFDDRTVNQPAGTFFTNVGSGNPEANGTDAYNGTYESSATVVGIGFTKTFTY
ncbi:MAG: outer membrane protein transport protein [Gammaproteobacteria bacterium]|nr:outer membrane protein transport protein [Gammaproteobacteria bacterium]